MEPDYARLLVEATVEVFESMSFLDVGALPPAAQAKAFRGLGITATLSLAGDISGVLALHCQENFARDCAQAITAQRSPSPAQIADTVGELANMIAGSFKRKVLPASALFELSLPCLLVSQEHSILYSGAKENFARLFVPFAIDNSVRFYVDLLYHKR